MVPYRARHWPSIVLQMRGSVLPGLALRLLVVFGIAVGASTLHAATGFSIPSVAHTMVGVALGLLLVFRTNASFDRWWEGRKLLGLAVNRCRELVRQTVTLIDGDEPDLLAVRRRVQRHVAAFFFLMKQHLRGDRDLSELHTLLDEEELSRLEAIEHRPMAVLLWISTELVGLVRGGHLTDLRLTLLEGQITTLCDVLGGCERIVKTPVPFAYAQHIKTFLVLFCFTAPFAMVESMEWYSPVASTLLAFALFGIDEIGVEIEDPFGRDPNDLPVDAIGDGIAAVTLELATRSMPPVAKPRAS